LNVLAKTVAPIFLLVLVGCASGTASRSTASGEKTWERPGLGGAVRPEMGSPQPGEAAPELTLPDLEGKPTSLSAMRGRWVLLHFTATWCPFCDTEVKYLGDVAQAYASRGLRTVIVDVKEDPATWRAYAAKRVSPSLVALQDATGATTAKFAPPGAQPSFDDRSQAVLDGTLLIDPNGVIRLFLLPDSAHFDPTFRAVRGEIERLVPTPVVAVSAEPAALAGGTHAELAVRLDVAAGYHVMSDRPSEPNYIPTRVTLESADGVLVGDSHYPAATSFALGAKSIATFVGATPVRIPVEVAQGATTGARRLRGTLRYQACTESRCLFPVTQSFEVPIEVR
jgi:peroxiredoxin